MQARALAADAVETGKIKNAAVTTDKLHDGAVTETKIASGAIGATRIARDSIGDYAMIISGSDTDGNLVASNGTGAFKYISTATPTDASVTTAKLANDAVTAAKIADNAVGQAALNVGTGSTGQVLSYDSGGGFAWSTISGNANLADGSVTAAKLATNAVTTVKIANDAVNADKLADDAVTGPALADNSITAASIKALEQICLNTYYASTGTLDLRSDASTVFTDNPSTQAKIFAFGGTRSYTQAFNATSITSTSPFSMMRCESSASYLCEIEFSGTFNFGHPSASSPFGVEMGMQFRWKETTGADTTYSSWNNCGIQDVSSATGTLFDTSNFARTSQVQVDTRSLSQRLVSLYRYKTTGGGNTLYIDQSAPFKWRFIVGGTNAAFPIQNRDYQFRLTFAPIIAERQDGGSVVQTRISSLYNCQELFTARRIS